VANSNYSIDKNYQIVFAFEDIARGHNYSVWFILSLLKVVKNIDKICEELRIDREVYFKLYSKFKDTRSIYKEIEIYVANACEQRKRDKGLDLNAFYFGKIAYPPFGVSLTIEEVAIFHQIVCYFQMNWEIYNSNLDWDNGDEVYALENNPKRFYKLIHEILDRLERRIGEMVLFDFKNNLRLDYLWKWS
jgi:hypothetical protein